MHEQHSWPTGAVPTVEVADIKSVWKAYQDFEARHPGKQFALGAGLLEDVCSPGADIRAITYRCWMLQMLQRCGGDLLAPWIQSGHFHDAIFRVGARIQMKWADAGVPQQSLPFDVDLFFQEVGKESR